MKNIIIVLFSSLMLVACGNEAVDSSDNVEEINNQQNSQEDFENIGDTIYNSETDADFTLEARVKPNETIDLDPVEMTINSVMIITISNINNPPLIQEMEEEWDQEDTLSYVQVAYTIENKGDNSVDLQEPIDSIVFNTKEQVDAHSNTIIPDENSIRTLQGNVKDDSGVGIVIKESEPKDIKSIELITGDIYQEDVRGVLVDSKKVEYELNKE